MIDEEKFTRNLNIVVHADRHGPTPFTRVRAFMVLSLVLGTIAGLGWGMFRVAAMVRAALGMHG